MANTKKSKLVQRIIGLLKLDDSGRVETFFAREVKHLGRKVKALASNKKTMELQHELTCDEYKDKLQDLASAVDTAKSNIDMTQLQSNSSMDEFREVYWGKVDTAEERLAAKEAAFKSYSEQYEKDLAAIDKKIGVLEARIEEIQE